MSHSILNTQPRTLLGNSGKKLRKLGLLPAVVYGYNISEPLNISLKYNEFEKTYRLSGNTSVIDLELDGKRIHTLVHDIQYHPVKDTIIHIDFMSVDMKKTVEAEVPLTFVGVPLPVKQEGAVLFKSIEQVTVSALPDSIPHEIEIDLSVIKTIDDLIRVKDIVLNKGVEMISDLDDVVVSVQYTNETADEDVTPETVVASSSPEKQEKE